MLDEERTAEKWAKTGDFRFSQWWNRQIRESTTLDVDKNEAGACVSHEGRVFPEASGKMAKFLENQQLVGIPWQGECFRVGTNLILFLRTILLQNDHRIHVIAV